MKEATLDAAGDWKTTFTDLPTHKNGTAIDYTVDEAELPKGYTKSVTGSVENGFTITNTYNPGGSSVYWTPEVTKTLDGGTVSVSGYTLSGYQFSLTGNGLNETATSDASGTATFNQITFSNAGTYTYTISEVNGGDPGLTYDTASYTATVVVSADVFNRCKLESVTIQDASGAPVQSMTFNNTVNRRDIPVTKVWSDGGNIDNTRPTSITVILYADGDEVGRQVLDNSNGWSYTFTDLPTYSGGQPIDYTVDEAEVPNDYTKAVTGSAASGFTITNTYNPGGSSVYWTPEVTKTLDGGTASVSGYTLSGYQFSLIGNGLNETATSDASGTATFNQITFSNAGTYTYTISEVNGGDPGLTYDTASYTATVEVSSDVFNRCKLESVTIQDASGAPAQSMTFNNTVNRRDIPVTKVWSDGGNIDNTRPTSITVILYADGDEVGRQVLDNSNGWSYTFTDLPTYSGGQLIDYAVDEAEVPNGYTKSVNGFTITNSYDPGSSPTTWTPRVTKELDGNPAAGYTFQLVKDDGTVIDTAESGSNGIATFDALIYNVSDVGTYTYTVSEVAGTNPHIIYDDAVYTVTVVVTKDVFNRCSHTVTITDESGTEVREMAFANITKTGNLIVSKEIDGTGADMEKKFSFSVTLTGSTLTGTYGDMVFNNGVATFTLGHKERVSASNLPAGTQFTVAETDADGYEVSVNGTVSPNASFSDTLTENGAVAQFKNHKDGFGDLVVFKKIAGNEAKFDDEFRFKVTLDDASINGTYGGVKFENGEGEFTLTGNKRQVISGLPVGVGYTVEETDSKGYLSTVDEGNVEGFIALNPVNGENTVVFRNYKHTPGDGEIIISGKKELKGGTLKDDQFSFILEENGKNIQVIRNKNGTFIFGRIAYSTNKATHNTYYSLDKVADTGTHSYYKLDEVATNGYYTYENVADVTHTYYLYEDVANAASNIVYDGTAYRILVNVATNGDGDCTATHSYYRYAKLADAYSDTNGEVVSELTFRNEQTYSLTVKKVLSGNDTNASDEFTIRVNVNDENVDGTYGEMTFVKGVAEFKLIGGQSMTASGLPYGLSYTVAELDSKGYTQSYSAVEVESGNGVLVDPADKTYKLTSDQEVTVTNSKNKQLPPPPVPVNVSVKKVWVLDNGATRPDSVSVTLYCDGDPYQTTTLNEENSWNYTWVGLDSACEWSVDETVIPEGFTKSVTNNGNTWTITNDDVPPPVLPDEPDPEPEPEPEPDPEPTPEPGIDLGDGDLPRDEMNLEDPDVPKTGDVNLLMWLAMAVLSGIGLLALLRKREES